MDVKKCKHCEVTKSVNDFYFKNKERTILKYVCKVCENKLKNERNKSNIYRKTVLTQKSRLRNVWLKTGLSKNKNFNEIFGIDTIGFKEYIESLFYGDMSWDNYREKKWEIDHKIPLRLITNHDDLYKLFHYTNLQPLLIDDHRKKTKLENGYVFKTLTDLSNNVQVVIPLIDRGDDMSIQSTY